MKPTICFFGALVMCLTASGCGDDDDGQTGNGGVCVREADEDAQCSGMSGLPEFFLCKSDDQTAPSSDCTALGDTGDYCCPGGTDSVEGEDVTGEWWQPKAGITWDWQLTDPFDFTHDVAVYDIDWEMETDAIDALLSDGVKLICYVSVGTFEPWRSDADDYPEGVIGPLWPEWDEYFVDIRSDAVRDIIAARMDVCEAKGFHAVEPDNMDVFELADASGFPLTEADGLAYAEWLAEEAHARGLAIFQKNASSLTAGLVGLYNGALTEDCFADDWCEEVAAYAERNKPVLMAEYTDTAVDFDAACAFGDENGFSPILKDRDLTAELTTCL